MIDTKLTFDNLKGGLPLAWPNSVINNGRKDFDRGIACNVIDRGNSTKSFEICFVGTGHNIIHNLDCWIMIGQSAKTIGSKNQNDYYIDYYGTLCTKLIGTLKSFYDVNKVDIALKMHKDTLKILLLEAEAQGVINKRTSLSSRGSSEFYNSRELPIIRLKDEPKYNIYFDKDNLWYWNTLYVGTYFSVPLGKVEVITVDELKNDMINNPDIDRDMI